MQLQCDMCHQPKSAGYNEGDSCPMCGIGILVPRFTHISSVALAVAEGYRR